MNEEEVITIQEQTLKFINQYGEEIVEGYFGNNLFVTEIATRYNTHVDMIKKVIKYKGYSLKNRKEIKAEIDRRGLSRIYEINQDYFKHWSNNMSYILGFIAADGTVGGGKLRIRLKNTSENCMLLEAIKRELQYKGSIIEYNSSGFKGNFPSLDLTVSCANMVEDLKARNIVENKSLVVEMPYNMPDEYKLDYIRGYFDGDGSVGLHYPPRTTTAQLRVRLFSGSEKIIEQMRDILYDKAHVKLANIHKANNKEIYEVAYSTFDSYKIYNAFYHSENGIYLTSKKRVFEEGFRLRA